MDRLEATADKDRLKVRVSWTEYHSHSYNEMLPQAPGLRDPLEALEALSIWMDGKVYPCPPLTLVAPHKVGNIHDDSLEALMDRRPETVKTPQCTVCRQNEP
jgi:MoaA/NifB/PqqE/SkfB family radical SAM enzyme